MQTGIVQALLKRLQKKSLHLIAVKSVQNQIKAMMLEFCYLQVHHTKSNQLIITYKFICILCVLSPFNTLPTVSIC